MNKDNEDYESMQSSLERKTARHLKKKKPKMKISGAAVKQLQKIIIAKGKKR